MNVLYIGTFDGIWVSDKYREKGFKKVFGDKNVSSYDFRPKMKKIGQLGMNNDLLKILSQNKFDIVFINNGNGIIPDVIRKSKSINPNTLFLFWYGDQRGHAIKEVAEKAKECDYLLLNNKDLSQWESYKKMGVKYIAEHHTASDTDIFKPFELRDTKYDIAFFGNNFGDRFPASKKRLDLIKRLHSKFNLIVFGKNWPSYMNRGGIVYGNDYAMCASRVKLTVGINAYNDIYNYTSNRLWNCVACGIPHVSCYYVGIENYFTNWENIVWFGDIEEAVKNIKELLTNDELRKRIGNQGRKTIVNNHSYVHRANEIKSLYEKWANKIGIIQ